MSLERSTEHVGYGNETQLPAVLPVGVPKRPDEVMPIRKLAP